MRVLLFYPDLAPNVTHHTGAPSYGIATLSAVLRSADQRTYRALGGRRGGGR